MRGLALIVCLVAGTAAAQEPVKTIPDSVRVESTPPAPLPPTPEQDRYLQGLRTAGRGVAQLKNAVYSVASAGRDSVRLRQAGYRFAGLCSAARGFLRGGRGRMQATAYEDSTGIKARRLAVGLGVAEAAIEQVVADVDADFGRQKHVLVGPGRPSRRV